ncbi:MAG TPA: hypothetical protein DCE56_05050 [Cyanobacteria bacterium UBA8553]|nr:hypothetical protein [Cyanobacteria bacterium UBA8553]
MVSKSDQKSQEPKTNDQRDGENESRGLGSIETNGGGDGIDSDAAVNSSCQPKSSYRFSGKNDFGKVIEELNEIREAYLSYIKADQERLEQRLRENRQHQSLFFEKVESLEKRILALVQTNIEE